MNKRKPKQGGRANQSRRPRLNEACHPTKGKITAIVESTEEYSHVFVQKPLGISVKDDDTPRDGSTAVGKVGNPDLAAIINVGDLITKVGEESVCSASRKDIVVSRKERLPTGAKTILAQGTA
jgi:hypothetical protein